jgi:hypothetical protein
MVLLASKLQSSKAVPSKYKYKKAKEVMPMRTKTKIKAGMAIWGT